MRQLVESPPVARANVRWGLPAQLLRRPVSGRARLSEVHSISSVWDMEFIEIINLRQFLMAPSKLLPSWEQVPLSCVIVMALVWTQKEQQEKSCVSTREHVDFCRRKIRLASMGMNETEVLTVSRLESLVRGPTEITGHKRI